MLTHYQIIDGHIHAGDASNFNCLVLAGASLKERQAIIKKYALPEYIFDTDHILEPIAHFEYLDSSRLTHAWRLSLTNLSPMTSNAIEARLEAVRIIHSDDLLIFQIAQNSAFVEHLIAHCQTETATIDRLVGQALKRIYVHFDRELVRQKQLIDELDHAARATAKNAALFQLADTTRDLVYLQHLLDDLRDPVTQLWTDAIFSRALAHTHLRESIRRQQHRAEIRVSLYRDLIEAIGGLFTDMMNNNLNHLMQYLNSAALLLAVPSLIAGIWGMNVGSLPGEKVRFAFWVVIGITALITITYGIYLAKKDYAK